MVFLKEVFEKVDFEKKQQTIKKHTKLPRRQRVHLSKTLNCLTLLKEFFEKVDFEKTADDEKVCKITQHAELLYFTV